MNDRLNFRFYYKGYTHSHADSKNEPAGYCTSRISKSSGRTLYYNPKSNVGYFLDQLLDSEDHDKEQCTGLRDKNGTFIYENDLIKSPNNSSPLTVYQAVAGTWATKTLQNHSELLLFDLIKSYGKDVQIIGNTRNKGTITSYGANSI